MFDGVVHQVHQRQLKGASVHVQFDVGCGMWDVGCSQFQSHISLRRIRLHQLHRLPHERGQIRRFELVFFSPLFDAREVQNIFDERGEPAAFLADEAEILVLFRRLGDFAALQALRQQPHRRNGRAQFVRHTGDEVGFLFVQLELLVEIELQSPRSRQRNDRRHNDERAEHHQARALPRVKQVGISQPHTDLERVLTHRPRG